MEKLWPKRLLIVVAVAAAFSRLGAHEFTGWDDPATIYANPSFNPPRLANLPWYWTAWGERASMGLYVPLTYTAWGLLAQIAYLDTPDPGGVRLNPFVYHTANVALHVIGALVAFELLRRLVRSAWAACAGALLWGLHPVQVEPVGWASGTKDVLCGELALVARWRYVTYARGADAGAGDAGAGDAGAGDAGAGDAGADAGASATKRRLHFALATLAFVGAMLSKPTGIIVPVMALAVDGMVLLRPVAAGLGDVAPG